jgi:hypothetical protein
MMGLVDGIFSLFGFKGDPVKNPFLIKSDKVDFIPEEVEEEDPLEEVNWGGVIVEAYKRSGEDFEEWEIPKMNDKRKLRSLDLDEFDMKVIREYKLDRVNYKLVKPYVVAGGMTNKEIGEVCGGFSVYWANKIVPRVKEAKKMRDSV